MVSKTWNGYAVATDPKHAQELVNRHRELVGPILGEWVERDAETGLAEDFQRRARTPVEHVELKTALCTHSTHPLHNSIAALYTPYVWRMSNLWYRQNYKRLTL